MLKLILLTATSLMTKDIGMGQDKNDNPWVEGEDNLGDNHGSDKDRACGPLEAEVEAS